VSSDLAQRILGAVESIPPGFVLTYGDVAELVGTRAVRHVGRVLSVSGGAPANEGVAGGGGGTVPWHRVLRSDGSLAEHLYTEQRQLLLGEGVRFIGDKVDLENYRWDGVSTTTA
jgi:alkylated DNA nucleotide flippase Atl1